MLVLIMRQQLLRLGTAINADGTLSALSYC